jgi:hypothetical protein
LANKTRPRQVDRFWFRRNFYFISSTSGSGIMDEVEQDTSGFMPVIGVIEVKLQHFLTFSDNF